MPESQPLGQSGVPRKPRLGPREYGGVCIYPRCDHAGHGRRDKCICRKWERKENWDREVEADTVGADEQLTSGPPSRGQFGGQR